MDDPVFMAGEGGATYVPLPGDGADSLAWLHTRTVDALAGYEMMADKAEPEFRAVAEEFRDLHRGHAAALAEMLVQAGRTPDTDGSFMATVNRAVVGLRALFDRIDADVLARIRSGEQHVLRAFDDAVAEATDDHANRPDSAKSLTLMRSQLRTLVDRACGPAGA